MQSLQASNLSDCQCNLSNLKNVPDFKLAEDSCYFPKVGLLQMTSSNRQKVLKYKTAKAKLVYNWQDLLYDSQGKMVCKAYKKQKQIYKIYQGIIED